MILKLVTSFGRTCVVACDAKCNKAWGMNKRPTRKLGEHEDDYVYLSDAELGEAPADPGTYEGGEAKPRRPEDRLNKWCHRECERPVNVYESDMWKVIELKDFDNPKPNIPRKEKEEVEK